jgi:hypothetical protein
MTTQTKLNDLVSALKSELDVTQSENDTLLEKNALLRDEIVQAENRQQEAEERAVQAEKKREALEALTASSYKEVVTELFEEPSRQAKKQTIRWATLSILLGLMATLWSTLHSASVSSRSASQLSSAIDSQLAHRIEDNHNKIASELHETEQRVKELVASTGVAKERHAIRVKNDCRQGIALAVAVRYWSDRGDWATTGWFVVQPAATYDTKVTAFGNTVFFYAKSANGWTWNSRSAQNELTVNALIDSDVAFTTFDAIPSKLSHPQMVPFFGRVVNNIGEYVLAFNCT